MRSPGITSLAGRQDTRTQSPTTGIESAVASRKQRHRGSRLGRYRPWKPRSGWSSAAYRGGRGVFGGLTLGHDPRRRAKHGEGAQRPPVGLMPMVRHRVQKQGGDQSTRSSCPLTTEGSNWSFGSTEYALGGTSVKCSSQWRSPGVAVPRITRSATAPTNGSGSATRGHGLAPTAVTTTSTDSAAWLTSRTSVSLTDCRAR